jgi:hypothetical protein
MSLRSIISRVSLSAPGDSALAYGGSGQQRSGVEIHNADPALDLWVAAVNASQPAPAVSASNRDFVVGPGGTLVLAYGRGISIYLRNSSGSASVSTAVIKEVGA